MEVGSGSPSEEATAQSSSHRMDFLMFCQDLAPKEEIVRDCGKALGISLCRGFEDD